LEVTSVDNSGEERVLLTDGKCPKEAYMLIVKPVLNVYDTYRTYFLDPAVRATRIITLTDFSDRYPAGSDVSRLFHQYLSTDTGIPAPFDKVERDILYDWQPLEEIRFELALMTYPAAGTYQFRVEFEMENEEVIAAETELLELY
jgi:hypothetical protein